MSEWPVYERIVKQAMEIREFRDTNHKKAMWAVLRGSTDRSALDRLRDSSCADHYEYRLFHTLMNLSIGVMD